MEIDARIRFYWIGVILGVTAGLGLIIVSLSLRVLGFPQPPYHILPLTLLGDVYCTCFLLWTIKRLKKRANQGTKVNNLTVSGHAE